jgi:type IV pilus assembly protein PilV
MHVSRTEKGFSLIEMLVAVLIVSIGLLGVAGMQLVGLKGNQQSYSKNKAAHHIQSLLERLRANPQGVVANNYVFDSNTLNCNTAPATDCSATTANCSSEQLANYDLFSAYCGSVGSSPGGMKADLSNSRLRVSCATTCQAGVTLQLDWQEQTLGGEDGDASVADRTMTINTLIGE